MRRRKRRTYCEHLIANEHFITPRRLMIKPSSYPALTLRPTNTPALVVGGVLYYGSPSGPVSPIGQIAVNSDWL